MKRIITYLCLFIALIGITGCGSKEEDTSNKENIVVSEVFGDWEFSGNTFRIEGTDWGIYSGSGVLYGDGIYVVKRKYIELYDRSNKLVGMVETSKGKLIINFVEKSDLEQKLGKSVTANR